MTTDYDVVPAGTAHAHPLVGARASGVEQYLHSGRAVLLNMSEKPLESARDHATAVGIETVAASLGLGDATAAVVRPDGYVWWATNSANPDEETKAALAELGTTF